MKRTVIATALVATLIGCEDAAKKPEVPPVATEPAAAVPVVIAPKAMAIPSEPAKPRECAPGPALVLADLDLESELRAKLNKPTGALKMADLASVRAINLKKRSLDAIDACIFPKMTGLKSLSLPQGTFRDLSPLSKLTQLESLRVAINEVDDVRPLERLTALDRLDLGKTKVKDVAPLAGLVNLTELTLDDTEVMDLSPLAKLKKLEKLSIKHTKVADVSPLKDLTKLKFLYIEECPITNLDSINGLTSRGLKIVNK